MGCLIGSDFFFKFEIIINLGLVSNCKVAYIFLLILINEMFIKKVLYILLFFKMLCFVKINRILCGILKYGS